MWKGSYTPSHFSCACVDPVQNRDLPNKLHRQAKHIPKSRATPPAAADGSSPRAFRSVLSGGFEFLASVPRACALQPACPHGSRLSMPVQTTRSVAWSLAIVCEEVTSPVACSALLLYSTLHLEVPAQSRL